MKTVLEYTLDLERDLNYHEGVDRRAKKSVYNWGFGIWDGDPHVNENGSRIIERHIKKIMKETAAEANRQSLESITNAARKLADASLRTLNATGYHEK